MKRFFAFLILAALLCAVESQAQTSQFSQPTSFVSTSTNSPILASGIATISMPAISLSITVTNPNAIITNTYCLTNAAAGVTVQKTFIYTAATMGTNFSTNFNTFAQPVTNAIFGQASQSAAITNGATIQ